MTEKFNYTMRQNSQEADDKRVIIREGSLSHKRNKKDAAPILRVEKTSIKITYYISFIFIVYFICGILFDTLSQENMTVFEVSKRNVHVCVTDIASIQIHAISLFHVCTVTDLFLV
jgi:hypothetical protein